MCVYVHVCVHGRPPVHVCAHVYVHVCMGGCSAYMCMCVRYTYICELYMCMWCTAYICAYMCVPCAHRCMYMCMRGHLCMYVHKYVCV